MTYDPHDKTRCNTLDEAHGLLDGFVMQRCKWAVGSEAVKLAILQLSPSVVYEVDYKDTATWPGKPND